MNETRSVQIHPQAVVDPKAELASGVVIGPGAVVGPDVQIGENCWIGPNVVLEGRLTLGRDNRIFPGACLGQEPQDLKYRGAPTEVVIGDGTTIRECVTINRATDEGECTRIGDRNLLMAYCHLGHNCELLSLKRKRFGKVKAEAKVEGELVCSGAVSYTHLTLPTKA